MMSCLGCRLGLLWWINAHELGGLVFVEVAADHWGSGRAASAMCSDLCWTRRNIAPSAFAFLAFFFFLIRRFALQLFNEANQIHEHRGAD